MGKAITDFEIKVLSLMWERNGRGTVQEILGTWSEEQGTRPGYTTILKTLQKLEAKGVVNHVAGEGRAYVYVALLNRREASRGRLDELVETVFGGDRLAFAHAFLDQKPLSPAEAAELRVLLDQVEVQDDQ